LFSLFELNSSQLNGVNHNKERCWWWYIFYYKWRTTFFRSRQL